MPSDQEHRGTEKYPPETHKPRATQAEKKAPASGTFDIQRKLGNHAFGQMLGEGVRPDPVLGNESESDKKVPAVVHEVLHCPGQPLDAQTRGEMEPHFGEDLGQVRVHTNSKAEESARAVDAHAYTVGQDIVFAEGKFQPHTRSGRGLLAHELAHAVQQDRLAIPASSLEISNCRETEKEANRASDAVREGKTFRPQIHTPMVLSKQGTNVSNATPPATPDIVPEEESEPVWVIPPGVRPRSVPIYDNEDTHAVIGFKYSSGGFWMVFDLEGKLIETGEVGLEQPLIDPIDVIAGILTGGLLSGGRAAARAAGRTAAKTAAETAAETAAQTGVRAALRSLSKATLSAIKATYRALRFRGALNFTETTAARMADPARRVPQYILKLAIRFGKRTADPQQAAGAFRYVITMFRSGKPYTLELVLREADQTILHFLYK